jgi:hypothetical protein
LPDEKHLAKNVGKLFKSLPLKGFTKDPEDYGIDAKQQISALQDAVHSYVNIRTMNAENNRPSVDNGLQNVEILKLLQASGNSERTETIDFCGNVIKTSTFNAVQSGAFVSTAEMNSNRVHTVLIQRVKKKNPLYVPADVQEFLEWLRLIIEIIKQADFTDFLYLPTSDFEDKEQFCREMDIYYQIIAKAAKGVNVNTLFAIDNYIRQRQASKGRTWTAWDSETTMGIMLQLRNASVFAPTCSVCSSVHCQENSCPYLRNKQQAGNFDRPGLGSLFWAPTKDKSDVLRRKKKCTSFLTPTGCKFGDKCKFSHTERRLSPRIANRDEKKD